MSLPLPLPLPLPTAPELLRADFDSIRMLLIST